MTINEIAKELNVSGATVSRAMNGKLNVKGETRDKILAALEKYGYDVGGKKPKNNLILMCLPSVTNPLFGPTTEGARSCAAQNGYFLLVDAMNSLAHYESMIKQLKIAGVIFNSVTQGDEPLLRRLGALVPLVTVASKCEGSNISFVDIDGFDAARRVAQYLLSIGRKDIAFLNASSTLGFAREREDGFRSAMSDAGREVNERLVAHIMGFGYDMAYSASLDLLDSGERIDAIVSANDVYAVAAIKACKKRGMRVPEDVSVVAFDNSDICIYSEPSITSVDQQAYQMGYQGCGLLIDRIRQPSLPMKKVALRAELIIRDSTIGL